MDPSIYLDRVNASLSNASAACPNGIPLEAYPVIQKTVLDAVITWELIFMLIGFAMGLLIAYLYFRIWYSANNLRELFKVDNAAEHKESE